MEYTVKRIIEPIMDFTKTCPFLDEFQIDMSKISAQKLITSKPPGTALDYVGSNMPEDIYDIGDGRETTRQANFQLWLTRKSNHDAYRRDIADFLWNFEQWVEFAQYNDLTPKIGDHPDREIMWADNGIYFSEWEGQVSSLYLVQLHIIYYKEYRRKQITIEDWLNENNEEE